MYLQYITCVVSAMRSHSRQVCEAFLFCLESLNEWNFSAGVNQKVFNNPLLVCFFQDMCVCVHTSNFIVIVCAREIKIKYMDLK